MTRTAGARLAAAGLTAYAYQVDLTQASSTDDALCVTDLIVDFGPVPKLPYGGSQPDVVRGQPGRLRFGRAARRRANSNMSLTF